MYRKRGFVGRWKLSRIWDDLHELQLIALILSIIHPAMPISTTGRASGSIYYLVGGDLYDCVR